jgi:ABC-type branched-subunit amino acid transport system substrate-binding protein
MQKAGIPFIGVSPKTLLGLTNPYAFVLDGGGFGNAMADVQGMYNAGCKKLALIWDGAFAAQQDKAARASFSAVGGSIVYDVARSDSTSDFTPDVTAAIKAGAQCIEPIIAAGQIQKIISAVVSSSQPSLFVGFANVLTAADIKGLGSEAHNLYGSSSSYPPASASQQSQFISEMNAYDASAPKTNYSYLGWANVYIFGQAAKNLSNVNNSTVYGALNQLSVTVPGLAGSLDFKNPQPVKGVTRLFNLRYLTTRGDSSTGQLDPFGNNVNLLKAYQIMVGGA